MTGDGGSGGSAVSAAEGLLVVDKPAGITSHDVVARVRRLARTRRVGHAGTLDPMATGVLVLGLGRATRLLGHLTLDEKAYDATIRLGQATQTDDAEGALLFEASAAEVTEAAVRSAVADLTGELLQVPARVSAVKVAGRRAYARVRAGEQVELAARPVSVRRFDVLALTRRGALLDVEVSIVCSSGTYVRALARDLGSALACGGHLTALRRTRAGGYAVESAVPLDRLTQPLPVVPLAAACIAAFPSRMVDEVEALRVAHGAPLSALGLGPGPIAVLGPGGALLSLVEERDGRAWPLAVFATAAATGASWDPGGSGPGPRGAG